MQTVRYEPLDRTGTVPVRHAVGDQTAVIGRIETRMVKVPQLRVEVRGPETAPLGVLIHPTSGVGADMLMLAPAGYRVLAPNRSNYGESPRSRPGGAGRSLGQLDDVAMLEDDVEEIATMLEDGGHLFGYSYGAVAALMIASRHPQVVRSLILVEPPAFQLTPSDRDVAATVFRFSNALFEMVHSGPREFFRAFMACFGDPLPISPDDTPIDRVQATMREQVPWDVEIDLTALSEAHVPTLVVCGDWDPGFTAVARHLAERLSGRLVAYPGADHFFVEQWAQIAVEVEAMWRAEDEDR